MKASFTEKLIRLMAVQQALATTANSKHYDALITLKVEAEKAFTYRECKTINLAIRIASQDASDLVLEWEGKVV